MGEAKRKIITLGSGSGGNEPDDKPRRSAKRGDDWATLNQVYNIAGNMVGPIAIVLEEMRAKVARCEDALNITDDTVAAEQESPKGTANVLMDTLSAITQRLGAIEQVLGLTFQAAAESATPSQESAVAQEPVREPVQGGGDID